MRPHSRALLILLAALSSGLFGCGPENPTNEPSQDAIEKAEDDREKAIDADPNMSAEDKARMKAALGGSNPDANQEKR